ncbi:uncharacterized protein LOC8262990 [Ricinus communis]|uniref:Uncharacterized protein n=1 Tax=Ricinus communis TaxID=3988 RepID=B9RJC0_RICCO|nr:uncharacterized protein LOC8262990 [Ricinus communis]EEF48422.1 conserved hypothetical protein [Ricinus communis]|eukprot:XP_002513839.1 uncharacterized protein LOC8262990 [Ricinus communis]
MGNGYNHQQNLHLQYKATFLPMLCSRPSIKDVALPKLEDRSMSLSSDPLSPKIGCMGQVKRHNKIVGFPTPNKITLTATRNDSNSALVKYSKLKRIFSVKNNPTSTTAAIQNSTTCKRGRMILNGARRPKIEDSRDSNPVSIRIEDMDPPLPVIKKVHKAADGEEADTIWKRRSGGLALKNLQLQQIQLSRHNLAPTTV